MKWLKRIVLALAGLFAAFYLINRPEASAGAVRGAIDGIVNGAGSFVTFFLSLVE